MPRLEARNLGRGFESCVNGFSGLAPASSSAAARTATAHRDDKDDNDDREHSAHQDEPAGAAPASDSTSLDLRVSRCHEDLPPSGRLPAVGGGSARSRDRYAARRRSVLGRAERRIRLPDHRAGKSEHLFAGYRTRTRLESGGRCVLREREIHLRGGSITGPPRLLRIARCSAETQSSLCRGIWIAQPRKSSKPVRPPSEIPDGLHPYRN